MQRDLEQLHKLQFPNVLNQEDETRIQLSNAQTRLAGDPSNSDLLQEVHSLRENLLHWSKAAMAYMSPKAKEKWILQGDENSAYCHVVMWKRTYKNSIYYTINAQGEIIHDIDGVAGCFIEFYSNLLGKRELCTRAVDTRVVALGAHVSIDQQLQLIRPVTRLEIKHALWSI